MKTKRNQWAIWICNHCKNEYPYEPVMCNDCGTTFVANRSFTYAANFKVVKSTREQAIEWWNNLSDGFDEGSKFQTLHRFLDHNKMIGFSSKEGRMIDSLTGREIEAIWTMGQTDQTTTDLTLP